MRFNYGTFLAMGNAGFISSTVPIPCTLLPYMKKKHQTRHLKSAARNHNPGRHATPHSQHAKLIAKLLAMDQELLSNLNPKP